MAGNETAKVLVTVHATPLNLKQINVLNEAATLGSVTAGLLTEHISDGEKEEMLFILSNLKAVTHVVCQEQSDPTSVLLRERPTHMVVSQGTYSREMEDNIVKTLQKWNGKLSVIPKNGKLCDANIGNNTPVTRRRVGEWWSSAYQNSKAASTVHGDSSNGNPRNRKRASEWWMTSNGIATNGMDRREENNDTNGHSMSVHSDASHKKQSVENGHSNGNHNGHTNRHMDGNGGDAQLNRNCAGDVNGHAQEGQSSGHGKKRRVEVTPESRRCSLRDMLDKGRNVRAMEAHSGLSALVVEMAEAYNEETQQECGYDALWCGSLCMSVVKAKPDTELVDFTARTSQLHDILEASSKPVIYDADTGGEASHFRFTVRTLERLAVSAVIIEDKVGFKRNSLFGVEAEQQQADVHDFCHKIKTGKKAQVTKEFMVIARVESLVLGKGQEDALSRADAYVGAGADAVMIHSRAAHPQEVLNFCNQFRAKWRNIPLVAVPSSYSSVTERELMEAGVNIVIYANHLLRAAFPAMVDVARSILRHGRAFEADKSIMPINKLIRLIPEEDSEEIPNGH